MMHVNAPRKQGYSRQCHNQEIADCSCVLNDAVVTAYTQTAPFSLAGDQRRKQ